MSESGSNQRCSVDQQHRNASKKVMLLFPPEWVPTAPYLALPSLTAVLRASRPSGRAAGHQHRDVRPLLQRLEFLIWVKARLGMQLKPLQAKHKSGT